MNLTIGSTRVSTPKSARANLIIAAAGIAVAVAALVAILPNGGGAGSHSSPAGAAADVAIRAGSTPTYTYYVVDSQMDLDHWSGLLSSESHIAGFQGPYSVMLIDTAEREQGLVVSQAEQMMQEVAVTLVDLRARADASRSEGPARGGANNEAQRVAADIMRGVVSSEHATWTFTED